MPGHHQRKLDARLLYETWKHPKEDSGEEELSVRQVHYFRRNLRALNLDVPDTRAEVREWLEDNGDEVEEAIKRVYEDSQVGEVANLKNKRDRHGLFE